MTDTYIKKEESMAGIELQAGTGMIEEVMKDYERENPGRKAEDMTGKEFADRMMAKMLATAKPTDAANH